MRGIRAFVCGLGRPAPISGEKAGIISFSCTNTPRGKVAEMAMARKNREFWFAFFSFSYCHLGSC